MGMGSIGSSKLNGWWRLWVLLTFTWTAAVAVHYYHFRPTVAQAAHNPAFIYQLERPLRALLVEDDEADVGMEVEMPNGYTLRFKPAVDEQRVSPVAKAYHAISVRAQSETDQIRVRRYLWIALLPMVAVALLGTGISWVRRGFKAGLSN